MKKILFLMTFVVGGSYSVWATTACPTTTTYLSTYDSPGYACTVGDLTFSDFSYISGGGTIVPAGDITVAPVTGSEEGLVFDYGWLAGPGEDVDSGITYTVTCGGCFITDIELTSSGFATGNGISSASETGTGGIDLGNIYFGGTETGTGSALVPPSTTTLTLNKDIAAAGFAGSASISNVANLFSTTPTVVPEPSLLLLSAGILGVLPFARRKFVR